MDNSPSGLDLTHVRHDLSAAAVIRSKGRRGFGANQNLVLVRVVAERRARYVLVLNDDAELGTSSVTTLVRCADQRPRTGAVGPFMPGSGPSMFAWPTRASQALGSVFPRFLLRPTAEEGWLTGACMLVRTDALAEVGLFDPQYFLFFEDTDLCRRLTNAGWHTEHCSAATAVHHRRQTTTRTSTEVEIQKQMFRSQYLYCRKHHGRLAARVLNGLARSALLARTVKFALVEAAAGRSGRITVSRLLTFTLFFRPSRPTRFEIEAREQLA
ncbi:MAG: glycosyltransferase [Solirubrobacteraceae bacterium]